MKEMNKYRKIKKKGERYITGREGEREMEENGK